MMQAGIDATAGVQNNISRFEFATAGLIIFGTGALVEAGPIARSFGTRALLVTGASARHAKRLADELDAHEVARVAYSIPTEPTMALARGGVLAARKAGCDLVIAIGGGSALDCGKAIAALLTNGGDPLDYMEVIGAGKLLAAPSAPLIAIPTTAGTGSEVTRNAVLASPEHGIKASLRSPHMLPRVALVDPELTYTLPPEVTASTGLDALTQLIEPFVSVRANPMTDAFCREGIARAVCSLRRAYENGSDAVARQDMALASLLGGLALGNAGLGVVHGFAGVIGGMVHAPHGSVCAALLAPVMAANLRALRERAPGGPALARYGELARQLTGNPDAPPEDGVGWLEGIVGDLGIPGLTRYGLTFDKAPEIVGKTKVASSTKANPIVLTDAELTWVLKAAL